MSAFILFMNDLKSFFYFFILDNHSLVVDTPLSFSLLPLRSHLQCFLYYLLWTTESVLGYPVFDGDGRILAGWFPNMCSGCYAQVRQFIGLILSDLIGKNIILVYCVGVGSVLSLHTLSALNILYRTLLYFLMHLHPF